MSIFVLFAILIVIYLSHGLFVVNGIGEAQVMHFILLSNYKWQLWHHGALHCLQHPVTTKDKVDIYCINDPEYLSVRYVAIDENLHYGGFIQSVLSRLWSVWVFTDRGMFLRQIEIKIIYFKITY